MSKENQAEMFIRLLFDALESDRLARKLGFCFGPSAKYKKRSLAFGQFLHSPVETRDPPDCVELMSHPQERRIFLN